MLWEQGIVSSNRGGTCADELLRHEVSKNLTTPGTMFQPVKYGPIDVNYFPAGFETGFLEPM